MTEKLTQCPVCRGGNFSGYLEVKDHFLTGETFQIQYCQGCGFRFVNPRPGNTEIGRYYQSEDYISHGVEKRDLISRLYKQARTFSIRKKYSIVHKYATTGKILDIGCGTGEFLAYCRSKGFSITGVEPGEKARHFARTENRIPVSEQLSGLTVQPAYFDCITLWHVLEHIHDLDETIGRVKELLAADGTLVIALPNSNSWDKNRYREFWAAFDVPRHLYHFTAKTFGEFAARNGFELQKTIPQKLDAYYVSMLSEKYLHGKINYLKALIFGFWSNLQARRRDTGHSSLIFVLKMKKG